MLSLMIIITIFSFISQHINIILLSILFLALVLSIKHLRNQKLKEQQEQEYLNEKYQRAENLRLKQAERDKKLQEAQKAKLLKQQSANPPARIPQEQKAMNKIFSKLPAPLISQEELAQTLIYLRAKYNTKE